MKKFILSLLHILSGNKVSQEILSKISKLTQLLMGIGSGAFPEKSGEKAVLGYLLGYQGNSEAPLIIFDVGANKGQYLSLVRQELSLVSYKCYSFEPCHQPYQEMREKYQHDENVVIENLGFDDYPGQATIFFDQESSLRASKYKRDLRHLGVHFEYSEPVKLTTLDLYCSQHNIDHIDLLKIDVEGNEINIMKGAKNLLAKGGIKFMTFEFSRAQVDSRTFFKDFFYFFQQNGMKSLLRITPSGYLHPVRSYDEKHEVFFTTNYLVSFQ